MTSAAATAAIAKVPARQRHDAFGTFFGSVALRLVCRIAEVTLQLAPLWLAFFAHAASSNLWSDLVAHLPMGSQAQRLAVAIWPTAQFFGSLLLLTGAALAHHLKAADRIAVVAALIGLAFSVILTVWPEIDRLGQTLSSGPMAKRLALIDLRFAVAGAIGFFAFAGGIRYLVSSEAREGVQKPRPIERALSDTFGHADWMSISDACALLDPAKALQGGVVIGEAYRVDQDAVAGIAFDPRNRSTWGLGGKASPLVFDLSFGSTHGIAFAGSGAFKTVSVCVPTLLSFKGPTVTLDPSNELAPMLQMARRAMGRCVIVVDPVRPKETGFNVLDWIDPLSPTATADIRAVVDWICGEKRSASAGSVSSANEFFQGRGKAMVETLLSDLLFDPDISPTDKTLKRLARRLSLPEKDMRIELERIHKESDSARARHLAGQLKQLVKETFSGVYGNMSEQTEWLANPEFAELVSGSAFKTRELAQGKLDLFLNLSMKVLETTPALGRCILGALLNAIYEADGKLEGRVLFLLDEIARLGFMSSLTRARDAGRKYGITLVLIYQSEGQLVEQWGDDGRAAWFESATWRSYSAIADIRQAEAVSRACGEHGVVTISRGDSKGVSRRQPLARGTKTSGENENRSEQKRRLIMPDEILQDMRSDEQIVFLRGQKPLRCGRAIYFRRSEMGAKVGENRFGRAEGDGDARR